MYDIHSVGMHVIYKKAADLTDPSACCEGEQVNGVVPVVLPRAGPLQEVSNLVIGQDSALSRN